ncbi:hypothetical protein IM538_21030 [Cytobacillus suaedae]|nr:hypothetical protein IM538_21030 [Cytobacillus suaedae]
MKVNELIDRINKCMDDLDLITARKYIEENEQLLSEYDYKRLLKKNARELLDFLIAQKNNPEHQPLTREEKSMILAVNTYATKFDIRGVKLTISKREHLLLKKQVVDYLNADAKALLEGMNLIEKR